MINGKTQTTASAASLVLAFLASSHHWLHMGLLMLLGGGAHGMGDMSALLWVRRFMMVMTLAMVVWSVYRLVRHRCRKAPIIAVTAVSAVLSLGFIIYTLVQFGW
ncbi:hypothetical protein [Paenibacillus hamazuiensis]|uniref:hypothetical protein n=1 Tax=Paenibacillus hamazuiensis TaxID=2936508 RepID=UPI0020100086